MGWVNQRNIDVFFTDRKSCARQCTSTVWATPQSKRLEKRILHLHTASHRALGCKCYYTDRAADLTAAVRGSWRCGLYGRARFAATRRAKRSLLARQHTPNRFGAQVRLDQYDDARPSAVFAPQNSVVPARLQATAALLQAYLLPCLQTPARRGRTEQALSWDAIVHVAAANRVPQTRLLGLRTSSTRQDWTQAAIHGGLPTHAFTR